MTNRSRLQYNAIFHQRPAALFRFFNLLVDELLMTPGVAEVLYVYRTGPPGPSIDYYDIEAQVVPADEFKTILLIKNEDGKKFKLPIRIFWGDYILSSKYPDKPVNPDTDLYEYITTYSLALVDEETGLGRVVLDSYDDHRHLATHPHHKHHHVNGRHGPAEVFSGLVKDMLQEISAYI